MNETPMTLHGKRLIEQELDHLIKVERENVKVAIAEARALGDLKENAEYSAAKEKQSHIEGRIMELQAKLAKARVVDVHSLSGNSHRIWCNGGVN
jgi:transcription elongation factor GreA